MVKNMVNILVLEDEYSIRTAIGKAIKEKENVNVCSVSCIQDARSYLYGEITFHLFFLDINMDNQNEKDQAGFEFAKEIRRILKYTFIPIIFITAIIEKEIPAYREIHCYQFFTKPFDMSKIEQLVDQQLLLMAEQKKEKVNKWIVKKDGVFYPLLVEDIVYIESIFRGICLHLRQEDFRLAYYSLGSALRELEEYGFFQCHKSIVVNSHYIYYIDLLNRYIELKGKKVCLDIGKTYAVKLRKKIEEKKF